ncbi:MAG: tetratricopeptide repeat protein [Xanthomonadales bacterium]|nr:tetratricopeptide repeat protein [Xanthomonadales bacterium]
MIKLNASKQFLAAVVVAAFLGAGAVPAMAQDDDRETKQTVAMSQQVYEQLTEVQEFVEVEDFPNAQRALDGLKANERLSPYERAQVWNLQGYLYYLQEDYPGALRAYDQLLRQPELPEALVLSTLKTMAQLQFMTEDYEGSLATVRRLMDAVAEPSADIVLLEGQIYYQMERYEDALPPLRRAVQMYRDQGLTPKENWLLLLHSCYLQLGDYQNLLAVIKELIQYYPKDQYILTLAGVHSELGDTKKQLALTEVLYETGAIDPKRHATNLANLYLLHNIPYKAAVTLEKEMENGNVEADDRNLRLLSQAWYSAREDEKAIPPLRRAADLSNDGDLYVRLGQSHVNLDQWSEAADAIQNALRVGGLKRPDQANILLGMALMNMDRLSQARDAFERASRDDRSRRAAQQWIQYVDSELKRKELLAQEVPEFQEREKDQLLEALEAQQEPGNN